MDLNILDRQAANDVSVMLCELHGRICAKIGSCGDMEEATQLSGKLVAITMAYNEIERVAAELWGRPANFLNIIPEREV